jgi:hypothetical protein
VAVSEEWPEVRLQRCSGSGTLMRLSWLWCRLRCDARAAPGLDTPGESSRQRPSGGMAATTLTSLFPVRAPFW